MREILVAAVLAIIVAAILGGVKLTINGETHSFKLNLDQKQ